MFVKYETTHNYTEFLNNLEKWILNCKYFSIIFKILELYQILPNNIRNKKRIQKINFKNRKKYEYNCVRHTTYPNAITYN